MNNLPSHLFSAFLFNKFNHMRFAYGSEEEMIKHFLSGEVTVPVTDVIKYHEEYMRLIGIKAHEFEKIKVKFDENGVDPERPHVDLSPDSEKTIAR